MLDTIQQFFQRALSVPEADEALDAHRIRKLADLLFVRHSDFIRTKLRAQEERGGAFDSRLGS